MKNFHDKRSHFRVDLIEKLVGTARIISANNKKLGTEKIVNISILDLSAGGMRAEIPLDLPLQLKFVLGVTFQFENALYDILATIVRKSERKDVNEYGLRFLETRQNVENNIIRGLNQLKIRQSRRNKVQLEPQKQKDINSFIKIIEAITEPAYLISNQRIIIAANKAAREFGVTLGERCHISIGANRSICSFCRLDEAQIAAQIIDNLGILKRKEYRAYWLYLEEGFTLHYFKK